MKYQTKVSKSGNSLSCRISKALAEELGICDGTEVKIESVDNGFNVRLVNPKHRASLPYREDELIGGLSQKKAYVDLLE